MCQALTGYFPCTCHLSLIFILHRGSVGPSPEPRGDRWSVHSVPALLWVLSSHLLVFLPFPCSGATPSFREGGFQRPLSCGALAGDPGWRVSGLLGALLGAQVNWSGCPKQVCRTCISFHTKGRMVGKLVPRARLMPCLWVSWLWLLIRDAQF